jgi:hypothetical protein
MWDRYPDGAPFLHTYQLEGFDKDSLWVTLAWFFVCDFVVYIYLLLPERNSLRRKDTASNSAATNDRFMSMDSDFDEGLLDSQR